MASEVVPSSQSPETAPEFTEKFKVIDKDTFIEEKIKILDEQQNKENTKEGRYELTSEEKACNYNRAAGSYNCLIARNYKDLINRIRKLVAMPNRLIAGVDMLKPDQENRNRWFKIVLTASNSKIAVTLRIRYGDLYLIGFCTTDGQWYEFKDNTEHFDGAVVLPYNSNYPIDTTRHAETEVGPESLRKAIHSLARYESQNGPKYLNSLYCLMTMFPEALRFKRVEKFVHERMLNEQEYPIDAEIVYLVKNWGKLSIQMHRSNRFASFEKTLGIDNAQDAAEILGLILCSSNKTLKPSVGFDEVMRYISSCRDLVEIFWVQILNIDNKNPGNIYGKIEVFDGSNPPHCIFSRDQKCTLSMPEEYLPLVGPTKEISAFDSFYIGVSLMYYDSLSPDSEVSRGEITWNYFANNVYNQPVSAQVKGINGLIAISYAVYCNAVTATVEVTLINRDNENSANIYGTLLASNTYSNQAITLFNKGSDEHVNISTRQMIPLLRSMVVIPRYSSINVVADLKDNTPDDGDKGTSIVHSIAEGSVAFKFIPGSTDTSVIQGGSGSVEVKVTWSSDI